MGPVTIAAVKKFQADNGLEADGWVGVLTLAKLEELTQKRRA
jgi:murein L,D-transpeptidase YcbB/YkuD